MREHLLEIVLFTAAAGFAMLGFTVDEGSGRGYVPGPRDPRGLRVVTWNVGGARDHGRSMPDEHVGHVASVLRELNADLVLLQEVRHAGQVEQVVTALDGPWVALTSRGPGRLVALCKPRGICRSWEAAHRRSNSGES